MLLRQPEYPVAFFANGIGDAVLAIPALRALCTLFRNRLTLISDDVTSQLCSVELPLRSEVIMVMLPSDDAPLFDAHKAAKEVGFCDLFISMVPWHSDSMDLLISQLQPKESIGFFDCYDHVLPLDFTKHSAELTFDVPKLLNPQLQFDDFVSRPPASFGLVSPLVQALRALAPPEFRILAVHNETVPEKRWPIAHLSTTLDDFLDAHPEFYAFLVGVDPYLVNGLQNQQRVIPCFGLSLGDSCGIVSGADLFLGADSCMLHVADFARVPGVGLFGSTNCDEFGFRLARHRHVSANGMHAINPREVCEALESLVSELQIQSADRASAIT